jgi:hypothetical protein
LFYTPISLIHFITSISVSILFVVQLATVQRTLAKTALHLENQRHRNKLLANSNVVKHNHIKELVEMVQRTKERLAQVNDRSVSAAERAEHLEEMIQVKYNGSVYLLVLI